MTRRQIGTVLNPALAMLLLSLLIPSCARVPTDQQAFSRAQRLNTAAAYQRFANTYPSSPLAAEARQRAAQRQKEAALAGFAKVKDATKASILERFIDYSKDNPTLVLMAKLRIAQIDFQDLENQNPFKPFRAGNASWQGFLSVYAFGDYIAVPQEPELREMYYKELHPLIVRALKERNTFGDWVKFLEKHPESPQFGHVATLAEDYLTTHAAQWDTHAMLKTYLALYDDTLKRPCPQRDKLVRAFQDGLAVTARRANTSEQYERYLSTFPGSPHEEEIRVAKADLEFRATQENRDKMMAIIEQFAASKNPEVQNYVRRWRGAVMTLDYKEAFSKKTPQSLRAFRQRYENSGVQSVIDQVDRELDLMRKRSLAQATATGQSQLLRKFLTDFPGAPEKQDILAALEKALLKEAIASGSRTRIEDFLTSYPQTAYRKSANEEIEKLFFKEMTEQSAKELTTAPLQTYLKKYPNGAFVQDGEKLMDGINNEYRVYSLQLQRAREKANLPLFSDWLRRNSGNRFAERHGRDDMVQLRRELTARQLVEDTMTSPPEPSQGKVLPVMALVPDKYNPAVGYIRSETGHSTGFGFAREGLLLTDSHALREVKPNQVSVTLKSQNLPCEEIMAIGGPAGPHAAVIRVATEIEPIPLGNPQMMPVGDKTYCSSAQGAKIVQTEGTFVGMRKTDTAEWLAFQPSKFPVDLGGVILSRRARTDGKLAAVGLIIPQDLVEPAVKQDGPDAVYALSIRSALPLMKSAVLGAKSGSEPK